MPKKFVSLDARAMILNFIWGRVAAVRTPSSSPWTLPYQTQHWSRSIDMHKKLPGCGYRTGKGTSPSGPARFSALSNAYCDSINDLLPGLGMFLIAHRRGQLKRRFFMPEFA